MRDVDEVGEALGMEGEALGMEGTSNEELIEAQVKLRNLYGYSDSYSKGIAGAG